MARVKSTRPPGTPQKGASYLPAQIPSTTKKHIEAKPIPSGNFNPDKVADGATAEAIKDLEEQAARAQVSADNAKARLREALVAHTSKQQDHQDVFADDDDTVLEHGSILPIASLADVGDDPSRSLNGRLDVPGSVEAIEDELNDTLNSTLTGSVDEERLAEDTDRPRCCVDVRHPRVGTCDHEFNQSIKLKDRYRKTISDFFGRNKTSTASIPEDYYPILCRNCYQQLEYRMKSMYKNNPDAADARDEAANAEIRCDMILKTLESMKTKRFEDSAGEFWPWWCGLELQLTNDGHARINDFETLRETVDEKNKRVKEYRERKAVQGVKDGDKRLHGRVMPEEMPDWLLSLCTRKPDETYTLIGERQGVRYSFEQLISIIKSIKTYCHENICKFPSIEAIPIPIGMLDEEILAEKKRRRVDANKQFAELNKAAKDLEREAREQPMNPLRKKKAVAKRQEALKAENKAGEISREIDIAKNDARMSAATIPQKRQKTSPNGHKSTSKKQNAGMKDGYGESPTKRQKAAARPPKRRSPKGKNAVYDNESGRNDDIDSDDHTNDPDWGMKLTPSPPGGQHKSPNTVIQKTKTTTPSNKKNAKTEEIKPAPTTAKELRAILARERVDGLRNMARGRKRERIPEWDDDNNDGNDDNDNYNDNDDYEPEAGPSNRATKLRRT